MQELPEVSLSIARGSPEAPWRQTSRDWRGGAKAYLSARVFTIKVEPKATNMDANAEAKMPAIKEASVGCWCKERQVHWPAPVFNKSRSVRSGGDG